MTDEPVDLDAIGVIKPDADLELDAVTEPARIDRWVWRTPFDEPPLNLNKSANPMALHAKRKTHGNLMANELLRDFHPWNWDLVEIELVWFRGSNRLADADNTAPTHKAIQDALVRASVIPDDNARHVHRTSQRIVLADNDPYAKQRGSRVLIVVYRLERPEGS